MVRRRVWLGSMAAGFLAILPFKRASAQGGNSPSNNTKFLEDQLVTSLRVVTDGQRQYIRLIVALVGQGVLPRNLVNLVARWAVERNSSVPFPYFQYALRILARRRGINVP